MRKEKMETGEEEQEKAASWRMRRFHRDNFNVRGMLDLPSGQL